GRSASARTLSVRRQPQPSRQGRVGRKGEELLGLRSRGTSASSGSRSKAPTLAGISARSSRNFAADAVIQWLMRFRLILAGALAAGLAAAASAGASLNPQHAG